LGQSILIVVVVVVVVVSLISKYFPDITLMVRGIAPLMGLLTIQQIDGDEYW